jgi:hypothetical protein
MLIRSICLKRLCLEENTKRWGTIHPTAKAVGFLYPYTPIVVKLLASDPRLMEVLKRALKKL